MKKILVISPFFYPHTGGSERYIEDLYAFTLKKSKDISVDVLCYNTNSAKSNELYRGMNIHRIPCFNILSDQFVLPHPFSLLKFLNKHTDYDLIHVSTRFFDSTWWAPMFARLIGAKIVLTDHCANHPVSENRFVNLIVRFAEATIVRLSLRFYDKVFAQNKKTKQFLKKSLNVDSIIAYPGISGLRQKQTKVKSKKTRVLYVGRMLKSKGVLDLFDIALRNPEVEFIFVGSGPELSVLRKEKDKTKPKNVSLLGNISHVQVNSLLDEADIFAYPSRHSEGLPMAILEAGGVGLSVIAMNSGAVDEVIKNEKTGILIPVGDTEAFEKALHRLSNDRAFREKLGKNLQNFVSKNFSWNKASNLVLRELRS